MVRKHGTRYSDQFVWRYSNRVNQKFRKKSKLTPIWQTLTQKHIHYFMQELPVLLPDYVSFVEPFYIIPLIAELSFCLWLIVKGVKALGNNGKKVFR